VDTPYPLKYGALLGIVRHTLCGVDSSQRDKVVDLLLETIVTEHVSGEIALTLDAAAPLESAVWDWFRQTALDGLTALKTTGTDNNIVTKLLSVIDGQSLRLAYLCRDRDEFTREERAHIRRMIELASKAAKTLGDLDYKSATGIDADIIADTFIALVKAVCDVEHKMAVDSTIPMEQIVIDVKICLQSVAWGIRGGLLPPARPGNNSSLYASLASDDPRAKRLNMLMSEIIELSTFLDEGDKANRPPPTPILGDGAAVPTKAFKFDLSELRGVLAKMQRGNEGNDASDGDAPAQ